MEEAGQVLLPTLAMGILRSRAMIAATRCSQEGLRFSGSPWQCPIPARVLFLIPWVLSMGMLRWQASMTSASVTFSHLHTTFFSGSPSAPTFRPFHPDLGTMIGRRLGLKLGFFSSSSPRSLSMSTIFNAIEGDPARPGESIPAAWRNPSASTDSSMIQSPLSVLARAPLKEWITSLASKPGTNFLQLLNMCRATLSLVERRSSGSWTSRAVGPKIRFPQIVPWTNTPLPK
mmetsp:Transcript_2745/g.6232  ORF Transcript_2745/g.6232 Transcript_2745/m.6232 type:complete len:231 (+) Transcript_2745:228-920(+)